MNKAEFFEKLKFLDEKNLTVEKIIIHNFYCNDSNYENFYNQVELKIINMKILTKNNFEKTEDSEVIVSIEFDNLEDYEEFECPAWLKRGCKEMT